MLRQCLVPSITKKVISYSLVLGEQLFIALSMQNFKWSFLVYLRKNSKTISIVMPKLQIRQK